MFRKFLYLEVKSFFRAPQFAAGIAMKISMFFLYFNMALIFLGGAFLLYFASKEEGINPIKLFSRFFLMYWAVDLVLKYLLQQLPTNNIKPLLTQNIPKDTIAGYTLTKILVSFFSWAYFLFIIPFTILLLTDGSYSKIGILGIFIASVSMIFSNSFINTLINKNNVLLYAIFGIIITVGLLHYYEVINIFEISERFFYRFYEQFWLSFIPFVLMIILGFFTFKFIRNELYLDKGLELKKTIGKTEDIAFLNRYGKIGTFINNDIRLIKRSKAARGAFLGGFFFLFYGLLYFNPGYQNGFMQAFLGIFVTGGFNIIFGSKVPAWDSSYYPLMMTQNVPYKEYLKAKWGLSVCAIVISMILAIGYAYISWEFYFTIFAAGLYNLGVNSYLTLFSGAYNKKPIDLDSTSKGFAGGQNNFNLKLLLITIPQMLLPILVFGAMKYFFGMTVAVASLGVLGLIGFFLRDKIFDKIVKIYKTEKYSTISAFKKTH